MPAAFRVMTILSIGATLAGCSALPFGGNDRPAAPPPLAPLAAAPTGSVSATPLPPLAPAAPAAPQTPPSGLAALDPALQSPAPGPVPVAAAPAPADGIEVGRTDLLGGWTIAAAGDSCQLFMTLTTWSGGYRASTKDCKNPAIQKIAAWNMEGRQIQLLDASNVTVARLYATSKTQYNGQTEGGGPVSVTR